MFDEIEKAIIEIQQPRSNFQLNSFVVNQHLTEEMRYYQTLIELQDLILKYRQAELFIKKQEIKIARLRSTKDDLDEIEAQELELGMNSTKVAMLGTYREISELVNIFNSFPKKFTRSEIEAAQPKYWQDRIMELAKNQLETTGTIQPATLESMKQIGITKDFFNYVEQLTKLEVKNELR